MLTDVPAKLRSAEGDAARRMPYIRSLDGVRAISVVAVLLYHAEPGWLTGGFLGVEVFFVISGYLITALLLGEHHRSKRLDLKRFWVARARRLLPALYLMLLVTATWWLVFLSDDIGRLKGQFVAALTYVSNWYLIVQGVSYFERGARPSPLIHLWSLAVEEQFYLVWPLVLLALLVVFRGRLRPVLYVVLAGVLASTVWMAWLYEPTDPSRAYYGTDTRAAGLLLGAAVAIMWRPWESGRRPHRRRGNLADGVGVSMLGVLVVAFALSTERGAFLYRGGFLLVSAATALLIACCATNSNRVLRAGLGWAPLVWIGQRSYGVYLWHWPIFVLLTDGVFGGAFDGITLQVARFVATFAVAAASYRYVEVPVRHGAIGRWYATWRGAAGAPRKPLSIRAALAGTAMATLVFGVGVSVAGHAPVKSELELALEQAAKDPQNSAGDLVDLLVSPTPSVLDSPTTLATTTTTTTTVVATTSPASSAVTVTSAAPAPTTAAPPPPTTAPAVHTPFALGDSVMLGASNALRAAIPGLRVDAKIGRQWTAGTQLLAALLAANQLGNVVVVHLGNNGVVSQSSYDSMMKLLAGVAKVVVLNVRVNVAWQDPVNALLAANVGHYPNVHLLDWFGYSASHPDWFYPDGTHLRPPGAAAYGAFVKAATG